MELPDDSAIPLLGIYSKELKAGKKKKKELKAGTPADIGTLVFIAAIFTVAKIWKQPTVHRQMDG